MDDSRRRAALRVCDSFRRGILTADEACGQVLFSCVEPAHAAEYVGLLPDDMRAALVGLLPTLPTSDRSWAEFQGVGRLDGDEWSWARTIAGCRANTEAVRACLLGVAASPPMDDFGDRVRAAHRARLGEYGRGAEQRRHRHPEPGVTPDPSG